MPVIIADCQILHAKINIYACNKKTKCYKYMHEMLTFGFLIL